MASCSVFQNEHKDFKVCQTLEQKVSACLFVWLFLPSSNLASSAFQMPASLPCFVKTPMLSYSPSLLHTQVCLEMAAFKNGKIQLICVCSACLSQHSGTATIEVKTTCLQDLEHSLLRCDWHIVTFVTANTCTMSCSLVLLSAPLLSPLGNILTQLFVCFGLH